MTSDALHRSFRLAVTLWLGFIVGATAVVLTGPAPRAIALVAAGHALGIVVVLMIARRTASSEWPPWAIYTLLGFGLAAGMSMHEFVSDRTGLTIVLVLGANFCGAGALSVRRQLAERHS